MNLINLIVWLSVGAVIGWFARWMVDIEHRSTNKMKAWRVIPLKVEDFRKELK